ncbi:MAG: hypothetical protein ACLQGP_34285 [Isosphaeraceae bacterium]
MRWQPGVERDLRRLARPIGLAAVVMAWFAASAALPDVLQALPPSAQEAIVERFLWTVLVLYWAALIPAVVGGVVLTVVLIRARRQRARRPMAARLLLFCASTLIGVGVLEAGSAAWLAWVHRFPTLPTRFRSSPGNELHVAVIGGSSAVGQPYQSWLSIGPIVAWKLQTELGGRRVVADVLAREGATLEEMHQKLEHIEHRPNMLILFSGHNEYQARFAWDQDGDVPPGLLPYALKVVMEDGLGSPLFRMVSEASSKYRLMAPPRMAHRGPIERPIVRRAETERLRREFGRRIDAIVSWCERIGAMPVLVIPADNEAGFEPNRSVLPELISQEERRVFADDWLAARADESDASAAMARYRELLARQPGFAESHFRLGRLLAGAGRFDEAGVQYRLARDLDGFPQRCPSPFQDAYRRVASRHGCIVIDGPAELRALSAHGILDDHLINDGHHPSLRGHIALAAAVLRELRARAAFGWSRGEAPSIDPADCALHFGIDDKDWAEVCSKVATFYKVTANCRYDPTERLSKAAFYQHAADRIAAGTLPVDLGIPGIGLPTPNPAGSSGFHAFQGASKGLFQQDHP